ncbi:DegT/DnrJ/EryC1/StrS family aminotransferase, partial [Enterococcus faecium]
KKYVEHSRFLATQARDQAPYYQHSEIGYNYRLSNISAGIGRGQMEVLNDRVAKRREIFNRYKEAFSGIDRIEMMPEVDGMVPNRWLSTLTINDYNSIDQVVNVINKLNEKNIETRALWKPLHLQPVFQGVKMYYHDNNLSVSEKLFNSGLCLPSGSNMTDSEQEFVIDEFKKIFK